MAKGAIRQHRPRADDPGRAERFQAAVAGWGLGRMDEFGDSALVRTGERAGGAIGLRGRNVATAIRIDIEVDSLEDTIAAAVADGGAEVEPPTVIGGGMGRFAVVRDTEGSEVGPWQGQGTQPG